MAYADLAFRTGKEEEDFLAWLWNTPFSGMSPGSVLQKDVQWDRVLDLFRTLNKPSTSATVHLPKTYMATCLPNSTEIRLKWLR